MPTQVPEHTWGLDTKKALPDYRNWSNAAFHAALDDGNVAFIDTAAAWVRQRGYMRWSLDALGRRLWTAFLDFCPPDFLSRPTASVDDVSSLSSYGMLLTSLGESLCGWHGAGSSEAGLKMWGALARLQGLKVCSHLLLHVRLSVMHCVGKMRQTEQSACNVWGSASDVVPLAAGSAAAGAGGVQAAGHCRPAATDIACLDPGNQS